MFGWRPPDDPGEGIRLAQRAIEFGRNDSGSLWMAALALVHLSGEIDHVLAQVGRSLSLNRIRQTPGPQVVSSTAISAIVPRQSSISIVRSA